MHKKLPIGLLAGVMVLSATVGFAACDLFGGNKGDDTDETQSPAPVEGTAGLEYTLSDDGTYYIATGLGTCTATEIVIGNTHQNLPVLEIGEEAFPECEQLTDVKISEGITSIGYAAFYGCIGLTEFTIPSSVTSIGNNAFALCGGLTKITIPNSVTDIGEYTFYGCSGLTEFTIPSSITSIGEYAFALCDGFTSIVIPNNVTSIKEGAFAYCSGITGIVIGSGVTSIGEIAFVGSSALTSITVESGNTVYHSAGDCLIETATKTLIQGCKTSSIPADESVTSIGKQAFAAFSEITEISIPRNIRRLGEYMIAWCDNLERIVYGGTKEEWLAIEKDEDWDASIEDVIIVCTDGKLDQDGNEIGPESPALVEGTEGLEYTLSEDGTYYIATGIGTCTATEIVIGNTHQNLPVLEIGEEAFPECEQLTDVKISEGITSIGYAAFYGCIGLTEFTVPSSVTSIGNNAFALCGGLTKITIPNSVTDIGEYTFYGCSELTGFTIPSSITSIGELAFAMCTSLTEIVIPSGLTSIDPSAFAYCSGLTSITVVSGNPVYHSAGNCIIETEAKILFLGCKTSIIPVDGSVTSIGDMAFWGCSELTELVIPDMITSIGDLAFEDCSGLTSITIPKGVTSIGNMAFSGCNELISIVFQGTKDEWKAIEKESDGAWPENCIVHCTDGKLDIEGNEIE